MPERLHDYLHAQLNAGQAERIAITNETSAVTYAQLDRRAKDLRRWFERASGFVVAMTATGGGPHQTAVQLAACSSGAVFVPVPATATRTEYEHYVSAVQPDVVVVGSHEQAEPLLACLDAHVAVMTTHDESAAFSGTLHWSRLESGDLPDLDPPARPLPDAAAMVQFTSGSTSRPKPVVVSHDNLIANIELSHDWLNETFAGADVFCTMPQHHAMGGAVTLEHLLSGSCVHLANTFTPGDHVKRINDAGCKAVIASPSYFRMLLRYKMLKPDTWPRVEHVVLGSAHVEPALVEAIQSVLSTCTVHIRYGVSEAVGTAARLSIAPGESLDRSGLVGEPLDGIRIEAGDKPVRMHSPTNALGVLTPEGECRPLVDDDGFLETGDLGTIDDGQLRISGRAEVFIKSQGHRISPQEIESVLVSHKSVVEAVVVGVPDPVAGEAVVAAVQGDIDPKTVIEYCRNRLSAYKVPKRIVRMLSIPRTPSGKPDRRQIRAELSDT